MHNCIICMYICMYVSIYLSNMHTYTYTNNSIHEIFRHRHIVYPPYIYIYIYIYIYVRGRMKSTLFHLSGSSG